MKNNFIIISVFYFIISCTADKADNVSKDNNTTSDSLTTDTDTTSFTPKISISDSLLAIQDSLMNELKLSKGNNDSLTQQLIRAVDETGQLKIKIHSKDQALKAHEDKHAKAEEKAKKDNYKKYSDKFENDNFSKDSKIIILLLILSIGVLVTSLSAFYLYRWRKILSSKDGKEFIKPENFDSLIKKLIEGFNSNTTHFQSSFQNMEQQGQSHDEKITNMIDTFMDMAKTLDDREAEIKRLKKGYDSEIYKKFLIRFIRANQIVTQNLGNKSIDAEVLKRIKRKLEDALAECEVETYKPNIDDNYRTYDGKELDPIFETPKNKSDELKIFEIIEEGYRLSIPDDKYEIIIPAKVKVYKEMEEK